MMNAMIMQAVAVERTGDSRVEAAAERRGRLARPARRGPDAAPRSRGLGWRRAGVQARSSSAAAAKI